MHLELVNIDWRYILSAGVGGGITLAVRGLVRAIAADASKRITSTLWGIRAFDRCTPKLLRHPMWSGHWETIWFVDSNNFFQENVDTGQLYISFNSIAFGFSGQTSSGNRIPYAFVGKLSRDKTIATGTWFDSRGGDGGYHGAFQLRVSPDGNSAAGQWVGFSETSADVKAHRLVWRRFSD